MSLPAPILQYISVLLISAVADANVKLLLILFIPIVSSVFTINPFKAYIGLNADVPFIKYMIRWEFAAIQENSTDEFNDTLIEAGPFMISNFEYND